MILKKQRIKNYQSGDEDELLEVHFKMSNGEKLNLNLCKVRNFIGILRAMALRKLEALSY